MRRKPGVAVRNELRITHQRITNQILSAFAASVVNSGWDLVLMPGGYRLEHRVTRQATGMWPTPDGAAREAERIRNTINFKKTAFLIRPRETGPWASVPREMRSTVRSYINSENEKDRESALLFCEEYELDYPMMRKVIMDEMIEQSHEIERKKYGTVISQRRVG